MSRQFFATDYAYGRNPAVEGAQVYTGASATGAQTVVITPGQYANKNGRVFPLFSTHSPILIGAGSLQETVTPSAVTLKYQVPVATSALVTATFAQIQGQGAPVATGTGGLQEAILDCIAAGGGIVYVDSLWTSYGGTTAMITGAYGTTAVQISDQRSGIEVWYQWNGSAFAAVSGGATLSGANGQSFALFTSTELLTLSTSGTTTDTSANLLPANSIIMAVTGTVTTTITTATDWKLGDPTTAGRFSAADSTMTAAENVPKTSFPPVQIGTGVASATTGVYQAAAAKVRVTTTGTPGAGAIRITVYGFTLVNATS